ncbi:MAG: 30S ribosomal protein S12 methylthiotransferase RimO [Bacteroidales bacterium]|nr:30S ribosomal protein S12 methylthiotransferase RimO [Bacteroidales bacterium]MBP5635714.1 30S ribosomal protein S12 methylthiotransferase RimO [Bacteroidales bacterium]
MQKVRIITLGCSKNTVDTEHILAQLEGSFEIVPEGDDRTPVDYLLLNTCGFISDAKEESIQAVLEAVELKKRGLAGKVIAFGCLSQRYAAEMPGLIPEVDAWYGARDLDEVPRALGVTPSAEKATRRYPTAPGPAYAYLKISEGCDRRCSYCAIPLIRGGHRSVPMEALVEEAEMLAAKGVKELILIAQDSTWYGLDLYGERKLAELIRRLSAIGGIEWIRIHYSYPDGFPVDTLGEMASNPKVCKYLDIPLQHIADNVLSKMHRGINGADTRALVRRLRETVPGVVLRTTMIVGHPGEGEAEFEELLDFLREARFERLGAFTYSEEEDTYDARHYPDEVPEEEKKRRLDALMSLQGEISLAFNQSRVGTEERVLVDAYSDGVLVCRSRCESPEVDGEILVKADVPEPEKLVGRMIAVRIDGADEYDLIASMI